LLRQTRGFFQWATSTGSFGKGVVVEVRKKKKDLKMKKKNKGAMDS